MAFTASDAGSTTPAELAVLLPRPGSAGANTVADLITVVRAAILQVPAGRRDDLLITSDGAGASHALLDWLTNLNTATRSVQYSVGFDVDDHLRAAANTLSDDCWVPCLSNTTGGVIDGLQAAELPDTLHCRQRHPRQRRGLVTAAAFGPPQHNPRTGRDRRRHIPAVDQRSQLRDLISCKLNPHT
jgi:hypothetical protein